MPGHPDHWVGEVLSDGRYRVDLKLAEGGSVVYKARDRELDSDVVVKAARVSRLDDPGFADRFAQRFRPLLEASHPNLVGVVGFGEHEGYPFAVLPYLSGGTLRERRERDDRPPSDAPDSLATWLPAVASALDFLHGRGFIHGNVKPISILFDDDGRPYLGGLGLAGVLRADEAPGNPSYMAPESIMGVAFDGKVDQYVLALIAYELLCGRRPFAGGTAYAILARQVTQAPPPMVELPGPVGRAVERVILKGLAKNPDDRYRTCVEFADTLMASLTVADVHRPRPSPTRCPACGRRFFFPDPAVYGRRKGECRFCGKPFWVDDDGRTLHGAKPVAPEAMLRRDIKLSTSPRHPPPTLQCERPLETTATPVESSVRLPSSATSPRMDPLPPRIDEVQFTVYRPKAIRPEEWATMLAFVHLAERRPGTPGDVPDPIDRVREQARQVLGPRARDYRDTSIDARAGVPQDGEILLIPQAPGVEFNPERRAFRWLEDVHREDFRFRAPRALDGQTIRGRLSAYLGAILIAEVDFATRVDFSFSGGTGGRSEVTPEPTTARPYHRIFASYSHKDVEIVRQLEKFAASLGHRYVRDVCELRAGEDWDDGLLRLIDQADVFQLFWSNHAMLSPFVRREWEYALSLNRPSFIRPTYWETPLPESPDRDIPPEALRRLHFHRLGGEPGTPSPPRSSPWDEPIGTDQVVVPSPPPMTSRSDTSPATERGSLLVAILATILVIGSIVAYLYLRR